MDLNEALKTNNKKTVKEDKHFEIDVLNNLIEGVTKLTDLPSFNIRNINNDNKVILKDFFEAINILVLSYDDIGTTLSEVDKSYKSDRYNSFSNNTQSVEMIVKMQRTVEDVIKLLEVIEKVDRGLVLLVIQRLLFRYSGSNLIKSRKDMNFLFTYKFIQERISKYYNDEFTYLNLFESKGNVVITSLYDLILTHKSLLTKEIIGNDEELKYYLEMKEILDEESETFYLMLANYNINTIVDFDHLLILSDRRDDSEVKFKEGSMLLRFKYLSEIFFLNSKTSYIFSKIEPDTYNLNGIDFMSWYEKHSIISSEIVSELERLFIFSKSETRPLPDYAVTFINYIKNLLIKKDQKEIEDSEIVNTMLNDYFDLIKPFTTAKSIEDVFQRFMRMVKDVKLDDVRSLTEDYLPSKSFINLGGLNYSLEDRLNIYLFDNVDPKDQSNLPSAFVCRIMFKIITAMLIERITEFYDQGMDVYESLPITLVSDLTYIVF